MDTDSPFHQPEPIIQADSAYYCQAGCQLTSYCLYYVFIPGYNSCFYRSGSNDGNFVHYPGAIAGQKFCDGKGCGYFDKSFVSRRLLGSWHVPCPKLLFPNPQYFNLKRPQ